ncbi:MAG: hypothetical protein U0174_18905 [Polyangiaceae bacterium]
MQDTLVRSDAGATGDSTFVSDAVSDARPPFIQDAGSAVDAQRDGQSVVDSGVDAQPPPPPALAQAITTNTYGGCVLLVDGRVKCWGDGTYGATGAGNTNFLGDAPGEMGAALPTVDLGTGRTGVAISSLTRRPCAKLDNGDVKCWGPSSNGLRIGTAPNQMGDNLAPLQFAAGRSAQTVLSGGPSCAILDDASAVCWGGNNYGQLGRGSTQPGAPSGPSIDVGTGRSVTSLAVSSYFHVCALLDNGGVKCWGDGGEGQLGYGDSLTRGKAPGEMGDNLPYVSLGTGRTATAIAIGAHHSCAILDDGSIKCWGANSNGQLGRGDGFSRGRYPNQMGDNLAPVNFGTGLVPKAIALAHDYSCVLIVDGRVKCWGFVQGGVSSTGIRPSDIGDNLPFIDLGTGRTAKAIAAGEFLVCVLLDNDRVKCWGRNDYGELGQGDKVPRGPGFPSTMGDNLPYMDFGP